MPKKKNFRSGFAALVGRPNVGKSTLLNRLTGEKLAIVSPKPQTTRSRILGLVNAPQGQLAIVDTPGIHQAKGKLNRYMVEQALSAVDEVDLVILLIEAQEQEKPTVSEGNRFILEKLQKSKKPTLLVINKIDQIQKHFLLPQMALYQQEFPFLEILPVSAQKEQGLDKLLDTVLSHLPEGEPLFPEDMLTDLSERQLVAEYVREQVLRHCRQEIPYSVAVVVEHFDESEREPAKKPKPGQLAGLVRIDASVFVERDSQKAIVIGKQGQMLKTIGSDARKSIERLLGTHVFLSLRVRVEPEWSDRADALRKMGYE
jgi:GTP-binding protein Era